MQQDRKLITEAGFDGYVGKPINLAEFLRRERGARAGRETEVRTVPTQARAHARLHRRARLRDAATDATHRANISRLNRSRVLRKRPGRHARGNQPKVRTTTLPRRQSAPTRRCEAESSARRWKRLAAARAWRRTRRMRSRPPPPGRRPRRRTHGGNAGRWDARDHPSTAPVSATATGPASNPDISNMIFVPWAKARIRALSREHDACQV